MTALGLLTTLGTIAQASEETKLGTPIHVSWTMDPTDVDGFFGFATGAACGVRALEETRLPDVLVSYLSSASARNEIDLATIGDLNRIIIGTDGEGNNSDCNICACGTCIAVNGAVACSACATCCLPPLACYARCKGDIVNGYTDAVCICCGGTDPNAQRCPDPPA